MKNVKRKRYHSDLHLKKNIGAPSNSQEGLRMTSTYGSTNLSATGAQPVEDFGITSEGSFAIDQSFELTRSEVTMSASTRCNSCTL